VGQVYIGYRFSAVMLAKAGIQESPGGIDGLKSLDSRLRGNDG
jgi:hypothetical protein